MWSVIVFYLRLKREQGQCGLFVSKLFNSGHAYHRLESIFVCPYLASRIPPCLRLKGSGLLRAEPLTLSTPLVPWPSKISLKWRTKAERYRSATVPPKSPVMSAASSADYWGKIGLGSVGEKAHKLSFYRPVCFLSTTRFSFESRVPAQVYLRILTLWLFHIAGINVLILIIPIAWVSHLKEWAHALTFTRMSLLPFILFLFLGGFTKGVSSVFPLHRSARQNL